MSEKKKNVAADKKETSFLDKVVQFFVKLPKRLAQPFKNMWRELKKVTWPTRENLIKSTLLVLTFMVFMGVVIGLLDMGSTEVVKLLSGWAG